MSITQSDLMMMEIGDLKKMAESYRIESKGKNREELLDAIQLAAIRKEEDIRQKVVEAKRAEAMLKIGVEMTGNKRPSPENIAILASPKVRVKFLNLEDSGGPDGDGADLTFIKGTFRFHLFHGVEHILPECLVVEDIEELPQVMEKVVNFYAATGMKKHKAEETAKGVMRRLSLPISCKNPVYGEKTLPGGEKVSAIVRWVSRFEFKKSNQPVPKHAEFGAVESEVLHA